jgi:putative RNA 2'-phosphotransferase
MLVGLHVVVEPDELEEEEEVEEVLPPEDEEEDDDEAPVPEPPEPSPEPTGGGASPTPVVAPPHAITKRRKIVCRRFIAAARVQVARQLDRVEFPASHRRPLCQWHKSCAVRRVERRRAVHLSKLLALALRHDPSVLGLTLDARGWTDVDAVLAGLATKGEAITRDDLEDLVASSDKQRYALSPDGARIRANQGHSIDVDLELPRAEPPEILFHGTVARFLPSIREKGLLRGVRTHVHLSADEKTANVVAARRAGEKVVLRVRAADMHRAGHAFYRSGNGVWLTEHVPPEFLA